MSDLNSTPFYTGMTLDQWEKSLLALGSFYNSGKYLTFGSPITATLTRYGTAQTIPGSVSIQPVMTISDWLKAVVHMKSRRGGECIFNPTGTVIPSFPVGELSPPVGYRWNFAQYPFRVFQNGPNSYNLQVTPRKWIPDTVWTSTVYHVDVATGNDTTGTGVGAFVGDFSAATKSPWRAVQLAVAAGKLDAQIVVKAGVYGRALGFHGISTTIFPSLNVAYWAFGGRVVVHSADALTWTNDGSGTNTFSATRAAVSRVSYLAGSVTTVARDGTNVQDYPDLVKVADQATCQATPGSWAQVGSVLYAHLIDGAVVSDANTRALLASPVMQLNSTTKAVFMGGYDSPTSGFDLQGGTTNCFDATYLAERNIVVENSSFGYNGTYTATTGNAVGIDNMKGVAVFVNCIAHKAPTDMYNHHQTSGGPSYMMTINCKGFNTGFVGNTSANFRTLHETANGFDFMSEGSGARGGTLRNINDSRDWNVGSYYHDDNGDGVTQGEVVIADTSVWYGDGVTASGVNAIVVTSSASVYKRGGSYTGAQIGVGVNTTYE